MTKRFTNREGFDTEVDGVAYSVEFDRVTSVGRENYGADADGWRGEVRTVIDDDRADGVLLTDEFGKATALDELPAALQARIGGEIDSYLERTDPSWPEDEGPDDDGRDVPDDDGRDVPDWWETAEDYE